ncbi:MAG: T9SS type A sorting domain-containing protein [Flavobacteriales bacterium]|nr:T9SS type A sorting domain-containing protein [Flavobacteriales bacterium]
MLRPFGYSQNILQNGGFEEGQGDWSTYFDSGLGYNGNLSMSSSNAHSGDKAAKISITQVPTNPQMLKAQLKNNLFHIESGHSYHLSLWLEASQTIDVQLILIQNTAPYSWLVAKTVTLSGSYQLFDLYFNSAPFTTDDDVRFAIRCGSAIADIYVDDVVITDCTSPSNHYSLHTSVTGKGTVNINHALGSQNCIEACNDQFQTGEVINLAATPEEGYTFQGWSGACSGNGNCSVTMDQVKYVGVHFVESGADNSYINYRNRTDWTSAGYEGLIPYEGNIIDMTQPPYNCIGNGSYNNYQALLDVLDDVKTISGFNIIYFPSGIYYIEGQESFFIPDNTVIRGNCSSNTTLEINSIVGADPLDNNKIFRIEKIGGQSTKFGPETPLVGGYHIGSNSLVIEDSTAIDIGDFIEIRQHNDTVKMASQRVPSEIASSTWNNAYTGSAWDAVGEISKVIGKNGNKLLLDRGLHYSYDPKLFPMIKRIGLVQNAGIENIKIYRPNGNKDNMNIGIERAYNCWVRNVESSWAMKCHVSLVRSYHCEIRDNYMHHAYDYGGGGHGYGVSINHRATSCLLEHNAFNTLRHAMVLSYGPIGNVCGYNFSRVSYDPCGTTVPITGTCIGDVKADISLHGFYPLMNLFEGNIIEYIHSSDWWGPSGPGNTFFRNRATEQELYISDNSHYQNVIGNELTYNPTGWSDNFEIDGSIKHTTKHSNNDLGVIDVDKINTLPPSLYKTNPNFNYGFPVPNIGPVSGINPSGDYPYAMHDNKAKYRYDNTTYKAPCISACSTNIIDEHSACASSLDLLAPAENTTKVLYGIIIEDIPNTYGGGTEGDPEIYIKIYNSSGSLVFSSENSYISAVPDIYISCDFLPIDVSDTYQVDVYEDDGAINPDDFLGTVSFQGSSNSNFFFDYISGELLQIQLNKESYNTQYQWNNGSNSNPLTVNQSGTYSVTVTNNFGCESTDSSIVTLAPAPQITSENLNLQEICLGNSINPLSINTSGGINLSYQWFINNINDTSGGDSVNGAINSSYLPNVTAAGSYYYYCVVSDTNTGCDDVFSNVATLQVHEPLSISAHPLLSQTTCENGVIDSISIGVNGGGTTSYQWYINSTNSNSGGALISGANSSSFTPSVQSVGNQYYYCEVNSAGLGCSSIISNTAEVIIIDPININSQPISSQLICLGDSLNNLMVSANSNSNLSYQWYLNNINLNNGGSVIVGANTANYFPPSNNVGVDYYYCQINLSIAGCNAAFSDIAEISIQSPISITQQPSLFDEVCIYDTNAYAQVLSSGNGLYQWYQSSINSYFNSTAINGAINNSQSLFSSSPDTSYYFCIVSDPNAICPEDTSEISAIHYLDYPTAAFTYSDADLFVSFTNNSMNGNQYEWIFGDGNSSNSSDPMHQYVNSGTYTIYLIAENNCNTDTAYQTITLNMTSIEEIENAGLFIYPNPTDGECIIDIKTNGSADGSIQLLDLNGKLIMERLVNKKRTELNLRKLERGEYMILYKSKEQSIIKKIILH